MKRIKEKESMDAVTEVEAFDRIEKTFLPNWFIDNFVDWALNIGLEKGKVLDIGTGNGIIPIKMYKKNSNLEIYGIDISPEMIKKAYEKLRRYNLEDKIIFLAGDGKNLPFKDNFFDLITCNHTIHHLDSPVPLFNEIARIAKEGAAIIIRDLSRQKSKFQCHLYSNFLGIIYGKIAKKLTFNSLVSAFTPEELLYFLQQSNLKGARVARYYLVPALLEVVLGIERVHKNKEKVKKIFPDNIPFPIPGKKYLN